MNIIHINNENIYILEKFIKNINNKFFTYFSKRDISCINNHKLTIILKNESEEIGYGHIDYENNIHWLGICILDKFCGNGYGKLIMNYLINYFNEKISIFNNESLYLCVHTNNIPALKLYEKYNFKIIDEIKEKKFYKMKYNLNLK